MSAVWTVIVGNVGQVYKGVEQEARFEYADWCALSTGGVGRAAGEPVTLLKDDVIVLEYNPEGDLAP